MHLAIHGTKLSYFTCIAHTTETNILGKRNIVKNPGFEMFDYFWHLNEFLDFSEPLHFFHLVILRWDGICRFSDVVMCLRPWQTRTHCHGCGHIVADTNVSSRLPARATFVADTNFVSGTQKYFWFCSETTAVASNSRTEALALVISFHFCCL